MRAGSWPGIGLCCRKTERGSLSPECQWLNDRTAPRTKLLVSSLEYHYPGHLQPLLAVPAHPCLMLHAATRPRLRAGSVTRSCFGDEGEAQDPCFGSRKGQPHSRSFLSGWTELFSVVLLHSSFKLPSWGQFHWLWEYSHLLQFLLCPFSLWLLPIRLSLILAGGSCWIFCLK